MLLGLKSISIGVALLPRHPALIDEYRVASPGDLGQRAVGFILPRRRLELLHVVLKLSNLVINFGGSDLREELPSLDVIADIDIALQHITAGARIHVRLLESERRSRQRHVQRAMALRDLLHPDARDEGGLLRGCGGDLAVLLVMLPHTKRERRDDSREHGEPEQAPAAAAAGPAR